MKYKFLFYIAIAAIATGCSSAYKATQTPDDVYYSPAIEQGVAKKEAQRDRYEEYNSPEDQYLRMKTRNPSRWSALDDYAYWNDTRYYSNNYYRSNWYNAYAWNNWYHPFYTPGLSLGFNYGYYNPYYYGYSPYSNVYVIKNPTRRAPGVSRPALNGYRNTNYNNANNNNRLGNSLRKVFVPNENRYNNRNSNNNNNSTYTPSNRSYTPASSGSSSGGAARPASGGGGGVSRPGRN